MKKLISISILCFIVICSICVCASAKDNRYSLYKTKNMYTFLKLDTRTGQIWQVHWSIDEDKSDRIVLPLSTEKLSLDTKDGRFDLFPTNNIYTFILLDTIDGKTWQVQWSVEEKNRLVIPITKDSQRISLDFSSLYATPLDQ